MAQAVSGDCEDQQVPRLKPGVETSRQVRLTPLGGRRERPPGSRDVRRDYDLASY